MGIQRAQEDSWTVEMRKWEARPVLVSGTYIEPIPMEQGGKQNYPYQPYPKMLYRAEQATGGPRICQTIIVHSEGEEALQCAKLWSTSQEGAINQVEAQQLEFAKLAAERAHNDRWMSGRAQQEAQAVDEATVKHLPVIPETPIRKRRPYVRKQKPSTDS